LTISETDGRGLRVVPCRARFLMPRARRRRPFAISGRLWRILGQIDARPLSRGAGFCISGPNGRAT
jgi:hypothetical protein